MAYKRIIGCAWIAFAAWLAFGVTSQAWKDRDQGFQTNAGWVVALILVICAATVWAACALLRGRTWAVRSLAFVAALLLGYTLFVMMFQDWSDLLAWDAVVCVVLPVLTFLLPLFVRQNEQAA